MLSNALCWIRSILFSIPLIILSTVAMGTLALVGSLFDGQGRFADGCKRLWARMILAASFVRVTVLGLGKVDPSQTYVFCSNHLSYMDPPVILGSLSTRFLAKKSLFAIPFLGWGMRRVGDIPIDRENPRAAARSLLKAAEQVRLGTSVAVFPEGGRSLDGTLQPFLSGAFRLAIEAQVPVVPLAIRGTRQVLAPGGINIHGGRVQLVVGDPVSTEGLTAKDKDKLAGKVRQIIQEMLQDPSQAHAS